MMNTNYVTRALINRQKRLNQIKLHMLALAISIVTVITLSFLFISFSIKANDRGHQPSCKYYKSIEITNGDTLWSIANDYFDSAYYKNTREYVSEIKKVNNLTSDEIVAGSYIIIPYYSADIYQSTH
ncbi:MAG: LysM peptidoglycan-binding domain-containing protein [Lachnospiraceae bacterium]|nr:LysM peptidoglycan-binding domain-containing protein [Lachnospiraceae bacterium]